MKKGFGVKEIPIMVNPVTTTFKLPKELLTTLLVSAQKTRNEFLSTLSREIVGPVMEKMRPDEFVQNILENNDIVLKKYNQFSFLAVPLSTSTKTNKYRVSVGLIDGENATANLSQIKNIDSKRLAKKICTLEKELFESIKRKTSQVNFG